MPALLVAAVTAAVLFSAQSPVQVRSRLLVAAAAEDTMAAPGNRDTCYVVVSVTDMAGVPVTGLAASNFRIGVPVTAPFGGAAEIRQVTGVGMPGFYNLWVVPSGSLTWKAGDTSLPSRSSGAPARVRHWPG